jgi:hypothetical protein
MLTLKNFFLFCNPGKIIRYWLSPRNARRIARLLAERKRSAIDMSKSQTPPSSSDEPSKDISVVTTNGDTAVAALDDFENYAGAGFENVTTADLLVPRLTILQSLSPQLNKKKTDYIEGGEVGHICDVGTGDLFPDGILFLPVFYRKDYLEWAPRASGQGLVAIHSDPAIVDQATRNDKKQFILPNGNLLSETAQFFGLNLSAGGRKSFIPMTSTQLKKGRKWLTMSTGEKLKRADGSEFTPPLFYRTYLLTTAEESNAEGEWSGWKVARGPALPEVEGFDWHQLKEECIKFLEDLRKGQANVDPSQLDDSPSEEEGAM